MRGIQLVRSVYVHVPFCRYRCGYCNFPLVAGRDYLIDRYLDAIAREIAAVSPGHQIDTLYLGGGTPSHLNPEQLTRLKAAIDLRFELASGAEFTAECNPSDLDGEKASALEAIGVNRISLGVQSFRREKLVHLERDHDPQIVLSAMQQARQFCRSVSIDLIFATFNESLEQWLADLDHALSIAPDHFSTYELTYEKGTRFWSRLSRNEMVESNEDLRAEMYLATVERLTDSGFEHYEISSFAKAGHRSRHNQVYWSGQPFFAFGPGASRFVNGIRETNYYSPSTWLKKIESGLSPVAHHEQLSASELARELLVIGLRRIDGIELAEFERLTSFSALDLAAAFLERYEAEALIEVDENRLKLSRRGLLVADRIAIELLSDPKSN